LLTDRRAEAALGRDFDEMGIERYEHLGLIPPDVEKLAGAKKYRDTALVDSRLRIGRLPTYCLPE
jgi:hypothetical protein